MVCRVCPTNPREEAPGLDPGAVHEFDFGDGWEHHIDIQDIRDGSIDGEPVVVDKQGDAPPQYPS